METTGPIFMIRKSHKSSLALDALWLGTVSSSYEHQGTLKGSMGPKSCLGSDICRRTLVWFSRLQYIQVVWWHWTHKISCPWFIFSTVVDLHRRDGVSNHQPHGCLFNCLLRRRSKETSKLCVTGLCAGNSPVTGEFPAQMEVTRKMFAFDDVIMFPTKVALPLGILRGILTIGPLICLSIPPLHRPGMGWLKCNSSIIPLRIYSILKNLIRWIAFIFNKCQAAVVPIKYERDA